MIMYHTNIWSFVSDDEKYIHYVMNGDMTSEPRVSYICTQLFSHEKIAVGS